MRLRKKESQHLQEGVEVVDSFDGEEEEEEEEDENGGGEEKAQSRGR